MTPSGYELVPDPDEPMLEIEPEPGAPLAIEPEPASAARQPVAPRESRGGWSCPACDTSNAPARDACGDCGLPRHLERPSKAPLRSPVDAPVQVGPLSVPKPYYHLGAGLALALGAHLLMCGVFDFGAQVMFHELGHAIMGWAFGQPSVPLPFIGFTIVQQQVLLLVLAVWGVLGYCAWKSREDRPWLIAFGVAVLLYPLLAFTGAHEALIFFGGHGGELAFACFFLWRALEPRSKFHDLERSVSAMLAWLLMAGNLSLFWSLAGSRAAQHQYENVSILGVDNDFVVIARTLNVGLSTVSFMFLFFMLSAVGATFGAWWWLRRRETDVAGVG